MPEIIREQLIAAIVDAVGGVYALPAPESEREVPITIVRDGEDQQAEQGYESTGWLMTVAIGRAVAADSTDREARRQQAHSVLLDLYREIYVDETFGGLADGLAVTLQGMDLELPKIIMVALQFDVRYHHAIGDPLTLN